MAKIFWRILGIRIKIMNTLKQICTFNNKGAVYKKTHMGHYICMPRKNNLQILFFNNLEKKFALCVYGEYIKWRKKC
jgi:hypothetical protein